MTDTRATARRWARQWKRGWDGRDVDKLISLYADDVAYWSEPFREPFQGRARLRRYFVQAMKAEDQVGSWFGEPVVDGDRAAVAWWASLHEDGKPISLAGISLLRFNRAGLVAEQWDGWNQVDAQPPRPAGWGT